MFGILHRSLLLAALAGLFPSPALAGETDPFSHADWAQVLRRHVDEKGLVDYRGLAAERETFDRYLEAVRRVGPEGHPELFPTRDHRLAYYLNAYNAQVFAGVLDKGPEIDSVWGWSGTGAGFFVRRKILVGGERTDLKKLEDLRIREGFRDPRVHAALNCASLGCPRLPREPFDGERLDRQLSEAMREFVHADQGCRVDTSSGTVHLSKIFSWFEGDFLGYEEAQGNDDPSLLDYVNRFRSEDRRIPRDFKVEIMDYDKGLNDQP